MKLAEMNTNETAEILQVDTDEDVLRRLAELGLRVGKNIQVLQKTPFNGPIVVQVEQTFIALRSEEAICISVKMNT